MTCVKVRDYFARDKDSLGRCKCPTLEAIAVLGMPEAPTNPPTSIDTGCTGHCQVGPTSASSWASLLRRQTAQIGESSGQGAQGHHPSSANIDPIPILSHPQARAKAIEASSNLDQHASVAQLAFLAHPCLAMVTQHAKIS
ncbi:hypothetical protein CDV31_015130 [Fusarium ambrosium]|uniref:Uncharacterized protein n=2 Tax=Fusarium solani species complex TaxID=232080 RepID=A0A428SRT6_9HYPO|nr:hypothetical protein CDV31_015130 [Fusarium ambrosium]